MVWSLCPAAIYLCLMNSALKSATFLLVGYIVFTSRYWQFYVLQIALITPRTLQQKLLVAPEYNHFIYNWGPDKDLKMVRKTCFVIQA